MLRTNQQKPRGDGAEKQHRRYHGHCHRILEQVGQEGGYWADNSRHLSHNFEIKFIGVIHIYLGVLTIVVKTISASSTNLAKQNDTHPH